MGSISSSFVVCQTRSIARLCRRLFQRTPLCKLWLTAYAFSKAQVKGMVASVTPYYYHLSYAPLALFMPLRMTSPLFHSAFPWITAVFWALLVGFLAFKAQDCLLFPPLKGGISIGMLVTGTLAKVGLSPCSNFNLSRCWMTGIRLSCLSQFSLWIIDLRVT